MATGTRSEPLVGYDISKHNGREVLDRITDADFCWVRSTMGNLLPSTTATPESVDELHDFFVAALRERKVKVGHYHFGYTQNDPVSDARWFLRFSGVRRGERTALDLEGEGLNPDPSSWADWILSWADYVEEQTGVIPMLYMGAADLQKLLDHSTKDQRKRLLRLAWWKPLWRDITLGPGDSLGFTIGCWQWTDSDNTLDRDLWLSGDWATVVVQEDDMPKITSDGWPWLTEFTGAQFVCVGEGDAHDVVNEDAAKMFAWLFYRLHTEVFNDNGGVVWCAGARTWAQQQATNPLVDDTNHGSGTACDGGDNRNHPYEPTLSGPYYSGFTKGEERQIRAICRDLDIMQWGGDFPIGWRDPGHYQFEEDLENLKSYKRIVSEGDLRKAARKVDRLVRKIQKTVGADVDGFAGPGFLEHVLDWQRSNDLEPDGIFGAKSQEKAGWSEPSYNPGGKVIMLGDTGPEVVALQRKVGVPADGVFGPATERAVKRTQDLLGVKADGEWGKGTQRAYDAFVDGTLGEATIKVWQYALGVRRSGELDGRTVRAIQRRVGVTVDGVLGPQTKQAVQRHLRVTADGAWGKDTVTALQKRVLQGRF